MMFAPRSAANLLLLCAGFAIWSSAFVSLYASLSIGCVFDWESLAVGPLSLQRGMLVALWLAHLALIAGVLFWMRRRNAMLGTEPGTFLARTGYWATIVALGVTIVNFVPVLTFSTCI